MARKEIDIVIVQPGRDLGKSYRLTEWSAPKIEKWAARAMIAMKGGVAIPEGMENAGSFGVFVAGMNALKNLTFADADILMDEMLTCVTVRPDPKAPLYFRPLMPDVDCEEVSTLVRLRAEVLALHMGFSLAELKSKLALAMISSASSNIQTSQEPSAP